MNKEMKVMAKKKASTRSSAIDKLDKIGIDAICERIIGGETMTSISKDISVNVCSMHEWIVKDTKRSVRAREARVLSARAWDDLAEEGITTASDSFELSKAKEIAYHYRWRASKIAPKDYGDKLAIGGADDLPAIKQNTTITPEQAYMIAIEGKVKKS